MAWRCSAATNKTLIDNLKGKESSCPTNSSLHTFGAANGIVRTPSVERAMLAVDRAKYVVRGDPYQDSPQTIGQPRRGVSPL